MLKKEAKKKQKPPTNQHESHIMGDIQTLSITSKQTKREKTKKKYELIHLFSAFYKPVVRNNQLGLLLHHKSDENRTILWDRVYWHQIMPKTKHNNKTKPNS